VPLFAIGEAVEKIKVGSITCYRYDPLGILDRAGLTQKQPLGLSPDRFIIDPLIATDVRQILLGLVTVIDNLLKWLPCLQGRILACRALATCSFNRIAQQLGMFCQLTRIGPIKPTRCSVPASGGSDLG
jgi:hypothetical protein